MKIKIPQMDFSKLLNYTVIFYAFLIPISRAGIVFTTILLILFWLFELDFEHKIKLIRENRFVLMLGLFILYTLVSILWSNSQLLGIDYARKYWYLIALLIIFTSLKKEYVPYVLSAFLSGMFLSEVISYGIFFELFTFKNRLPSDPTPFMNHLQYSLFLAFTALLLLNKIFDEKNIYLRNFYIFYFISATVNLFMNGGRTGQVAFLFTLGIVRLINMKNKLMAFGISAIFVGLIFVIGYSISPNFENRINEGKRDIEQLFTKGDYCTSIGQRIGMWMVGGDLICDNLLFGVGVGDEINSMKQEIIENQPEKMCIVNNGMPHFHNDLIQISVQLGVVGGIIYLLIFYFMATIKLSEPFYKKTLITFVIVYFVSSQFEVMIHAQFSMVLFTLFAGLFLAISRMENETRVC